MNVTVGTTAVKLDVPSTSRPLIQNLGTGKLYFGTDNTVTAANGIQVLAGAAYEFARPLNEGETGDVWMIGDTAGTDVRVLAL